MTDNERVRMIQETRKMIDDFPSNKIMFEEAAEHGAILYKIAYDANIRAGFTELQALRLAKNHFD